MDSSSQQGQEPRLFDRIREVFRLKHYSRRTEQTYLLWIRQYILFHKKNHPGEMGAEEVTAYLTFLAVKRKVSASTQNVALSAILFLYIQVLHLVLGFEGLCLHRFNYVLYSMRLSQRTA